MNFAGFFVYFTHFFPILELLYSINVLTHYYFILGWKVSCILNLSWWQKLLARSLSSVAQSCPTLPTPWTVACQVPLSMGFSRQAYWSELHGLLQSVSMSTSSISIYLSIIYVSYGFYFSGELWLIQLYSFIHILLQIYVYILTLFFSNFHFFILALFWEISLVLFPYFILKGKGKSFSRVRLLATPWTAAHHVPPSMGFSRQECWSGVPYF